MVIKVARPIKTFKSWPPAADGTVGIGTITPGAKLESVSSTGAQLRLSHTTASKFLDVTVDTNHDATFKPSSTGQIIFQPTTDSVDFLQILDANGGTPIFQADSTNENIKQKSGQTALLTGWQDSAGTTIASMSIFGIFSTSTLSGTTGASIGGTSIDVQNRTATVGNYSGVRGKNANGDVLGAYQFVADSHVAGTGQLRMGTSSAGTYAEAMRIDSSGNVGIGTTTPAANLQVSGASSPFLLITDTTNPCSTVIQSQDAEGFFGTTTAHPLSFTTNGSRVMTLTTAGNVGIGLTAPQGILHTYDTIGGFLIWEYDGLDATVRTVVPNGAGDCLYRLQVTWVFRNSAGVVVSGSIGVSNGGSTSPTVGTDTVRIRVNADGSIDVARTAGTNTIKVLLHLLWL
jgi:hypothetical protein